MHSLDGAFAVRGVMFMEIQAGMQTRTAAQLKGLEPLSSLQFPLPAEAHAQAQTTPSITSTTLVNTKENTLYQAFQDSSGTTAVGDLSSNHQKDHR